MNVECTDNCIIYCVEVSSEGVMGIEHLWNLDVDGKLILKWILKYHALYEDVV
jgi:hypothetical protein